MTLEELRKESAKLGYSLVKSIDNNNSIEVLGLSTKVLNLLKKSNIFKIFDLLEDIEHGNLADIKGFGGKELREVLERLEFFNIPFDTSGLFSELCSERTKTARMKDMLIYLDYRELKSVFPRIEAFDKEVASIVDDVIWNMGSISDYKDDED